MNWERYRESQSRLLSDKISMPLMSVSKDIKLSYEDADRIMNQLLNCMHPEDANQLIYMLWNIYWIDMGLLIK